MLERVTATTTVSNSIVTNEPAEVTKTGKSNKDVDGYLTCLTSDALTRFHIPSAYETCGQQTSCLLVKHA